MMVDRRVEATDFAPTSQQDLLLRQAARRRRGSLEKGATATPQDILPQAAQIELPRETKPAASFVPLQEWEGYVTDIEADVFRARLVDVTAGDESETELVELPLADLDPDARSDLKQGAIFRWIIGYQISRDRPRIKGSQIVFRQLPRIQASQLKAAIDRGAERAKKIKWE
jgi:hypothetical protein